MTMTSTNQTEPRQLVYKPLGEIVEAERNARFHDDDEDLDESIDRLGFINPAIEDGRTGRLIAGHGRRARLRQKEQDGGPPPEGIVVQDGRWMMPVVTGWSSETDDEAELAAVALNKIGEGRWDESTLYDILVAQDDLSGVGFSTNDLDDMRALAEEMSVPITPMMMGDSPLSGPSGLDDDDETGDEPDSEEGAAAPAAASAPSMSMPKPERGALGGFNPVTIEHTDPPNGKKTGAGESEGSYVEPTFSERLPEYRQRTVRTVVMDFPLEEYERVMGMMNRLREKRGVASNADLFVLMLTEADTETDS